MSGNASRKTKFRTLSKSVLRKYHTHANAVLALSDQPNGEELCREVYDGRCAIVEYVMPGFALAKMAADAQKKMPKAEGLVLLKHGSNIKRLIRREELSLDKNA